jgi:hypothetical protein
MFQGIYYNPGRGGGSNILRGRAKGAMFLQTETSNSNSILNNNLLNEINNKQEVDIEYLNIDS